MLKKIYSTNTEDCPRRAVAEETATCDPIFLLQIRRWIYLPDAPGFEWPDGWMLDDDGELLDENGNAVTNQMCEDHGCARHYWETVAVFATREQARRMGNSREYDWGEGEGWRTYAVSCHGQLAELLVRHWRPEDG